MKNLTVKDPIKQILDENNTENVVLFDEQQNPIEFEQIALIPLERTNGLYAILAPITPMEGVEEGEGVLFKLDEENSNLEIERDESVIDDVLSVYEKLVEEGNGENN